MPSNCCVPGCRSYGSRGSSKKRMFRLSYKDCPARYKIWLNRIGNETLLKKTPAVVQSVYRICEDHFEPMCFIPSEYRSRRYLKRRSLPTLKLPGFNQESTEKSCFLPANEYYNPMCYSHFAASLNNPSADCLGPEDNDQQSINYTENESVDINIKLDYDKDQNIEPESTIDIKYNSLIDLFRNSTPTKNNNEKIEIIVDDVALSNEQMNNTPKNNSRNNDEQVETDSVGNNYGNDEDIFESNRRIKAEYVNDRIEHEIASRGNVCINQKSSSRSTEDNIGTSILIIEPITAQDSTITGNNGSTMADLHRDRVLLKRKCQQVLGENEFLKRKLKKRGLLLQIANKKVEEYETKLKMYQELLVKHGIEH